MAAEEKITLVNLTGLTLDKITNLNIHLDLNYQTVHRLLSYLDSIFDEDRKFSEDKEENKKILTRLLNMINEIIRRQTSSDINRIIKDLIENIGQNIRLLSTILDQEYFKEFSEQLQISKQGIEKNINSATAATAAAAAATAAEKKYLKYKTKYLNLKKIIN